jgi:hypothetical protein
MATQEWPAGTTVGACFAYERHRQLASLSDACSVPVSDIQPTDEVTTIEGLRQPSASSCIRCSRRG